MSAGRILSERPVYLVAAVTAAAVFVLLCVFFVLPLVAAFSPLFSGRLSVTEVLALIFSSKVRNAALYTVRQAAVSTVIAFAVGVPAAFFISCREFPLRKIISALSPIPLCLPPLLMALGFVLFFGMQGSANRILTSVFNLSEPPLTFLYSFTGLVLAHGFYNFPLIMRSVADVWSQLPQQEADAARLLGAGRLRVFCTVTFVQLLPAALSASMLVFLYCFFSFIIVLLFGTIGGSTLEVQIYQAARTSIDFESAAALSFAETVLAFCFIAAYGILSLKTERSRGVSFSGAGIKRRRLCGAGEYAGACVLFIIIFIFFIAPLASIVCNAFVSRQGYLQDASAFAGMIPRLSFDSFKTVLGRQGFYAAAKNTLITGICSSLLATTGGAVYAFAVQRRFTALPVRCVPMLPMAVSSVIMGFGFTILVRRGTPAILICAQAALYWPFALRQISPAVARIPQNVIDASRLLSCSHLDTVFRIYVPMTARSLISAFCFCFALSCGDASLPLILAIPRFDTLALYTYRLAGAYRLAQACVCGLLLGVCTAIIFAVGDRINTFNTGKDCEND